MTKSQISRSWASKLAAAAEYAFSFSVGPNTVRTIFSSRDSRDVFAGRFHDARSAAEPQIVVFVVETEGDLYLWGDGGLLYSWTSDSFDPQVVAFFADAVVMREVVRFGSVIALHAAVVATERRVGAIIGVSAAGKTTTSIACVRRGLRFYSDERCIISGGIVFPFLRALTLRASARRLLAESRAGNPVIVDVPHFPSIDDDILALPSVLFGPAAGGPPRPLNTAFLITGNGEIAKAQRTTLHDALPALLASFEAPDRELERVGRALTEFSSVECYRLELGPPDQTAALIAETLDA